MIQSTLLNNLRFFINKYTQLLKTSHLWPQVYQIVAWQQRYSPCKSKKLNFKREIENNFIKNPNFRSEFFSWVIWSKRNWSYAFSKWNLWQITSNWLFQRNVGSDLERAQKSEHCYRWWSSIELHQPGSLRYSGTGTFVHFYKIPTPSKSVQKSHSHFRIL